MNWDMNWDLVGQYLDELDHDLHGDVAGMIGMVRGTYSHSWPTILQVSEFLLFIAIDK